MTVRTAWIATASAIAALLIALLELSGAVRFLLAALPFLLPGIAWAWANRAAYRRRPADAAVPLFLAWALMTASRALLPAALTGPLPFAALSLAASAAALWIRANRKEAPRSDGPGLPTASILESILLPATLLLAVVLVAGPFLLVGSETPRGHAFPAYFDYDFLQHRAIAESLATSIPPANPYLAGETLRYYWLSHLFPAAVVPGLAAGGADPLRAHLACQLLIGLLFLGALVSVLLRACERLPQGQAGTGGMVQTRPEPGYSPNGRRPGLNHAFDLYAAGQGPRRDSVTDLVTPSVEPCRSGFPPRAAAWALGFLLLACSWKGLFNLASPLVEGLAPDLLRVPSAGESRMVAVSSLSHGLFRDLLYEGQALSALGLVILAATRLPSGLVGSCLAGSAGMLALGFDAFVGFLGLLGLGLAQLLAAGTMRQRLARGLGLAAGALPVALAFRHLGMFQGEPPMLEPWWRMIALWPGYALVEYGPMLVLACLALWAWRGRLRELLAETPLGKLVLLALVALAAGLVLGLPVHREMFLRKGVKLAQLGMAVLAGAWMAGCMARGPWRVATVSLALAATALPSLAFDLYGHTAVHDPSRSSYVSADELAACRWIAANTPREARFLELPRRDDYSIVPSLAGRPDVVGNVHHAALFQVDAAGARARIQGVRTAFATGNVDELLGVAQRYSAAYLVCGPYERALRPDLDGRLAGRAGLVLCYEGGSVKVYRIDWSRVGSEQPMQNGKDRSPDE